MFWKEKNRQKGDKMNEFLEKIYKTSDTNNVADMIFGFIEGAINAKEYYIIDCFLEAIDENMLDANILVFITILTYCIMDKLQNREDFLDRAEVRLIELLQDEDRARNLIVRRRANVGNV